MQIRALCLSLFLLQICVHICITLLLVNYVKACVILVSALSRGNDIFFQANFLCRTRVLLIFAQLSKERMRDSVEMPGHHPSSFLLPSTISSVTVS